MHYNLAFEVSITQFTDKNTQWPGRKTHLMTMYTSAATTKAVAITCLCTQLMSLHFLVIYY